MNFLLSIWMIVLSIIVTLCIIQISLADRAINEAAIKRSNIVSLLHALGITIPIYLCERKAISNHYIDCTVENQLRLSSYSYLLIGQSFRNKSQLKSLDRSQSRVSVYLLFNTAFIMLFFSLWGLPKPITISRKNKCC